MTFKTHGEDYRPSQHARVRRAVRNVARAAAFHAHARVLENEGTALVDMASQAGLFRVERRLHHRVLASHAPRRRESAVRIVAIRAGHRSFVHTMMRWQLELAANTLVARITKFRLPLRQKKTRCGRVVYRMTVCTDHIG